jgi:hypothetical protein
MDGKSVLYGRKTTALTKLMELTAWALTCLYLGDYYRTYPKTVEDEVRAALAAPEDFIRGPISIIRDSPSNLRAGFTRFATENYLSARCLAMHIGSPMNSLQCWRRVKKGCVDISALSLGHATGLAAASSASARLACSAM